MIPKETFDLQRQANALESARLDRLYPVFPTTTSRAYLGNDDPRAVRCSTLTLRVPSWGWATIRLPVAMPLPIRFDRTAVPTIYEPVYGLYGDVPWKIIDARIKWETR